MRIGFNPNKNKKLSKSDYFHQVIVPVYIPNQIDYFKDSFQILKICLESLFKSSHPKTYFTIINNGSCNEVIGYLNKMLNEGKLHEVIHTSSIGKLNAILKGITGHQFPLITISDADVLFLNGWQNATYDVFEAFPKAGVVSTTPSSKVLKQFTGNVLINNLFSSKLRFKDVLNSNDLLMFAKSIGKEDFYNSAHLKKYLTISNKNLTAVVGAGHFVATYRGNIFDIQKSRYSSFALGGASESLFLDKPVNDLGYWRLSTQKNYTYHMGNIIEEWMFTKLENATNITQSSLNLNFFLNSKSVSKFVFFNTFFFKLLTFKSIWKLFLRCKGLTKEEVNIY